VNYKIFFLIPLILSIGLIPQLMSNALAEENTVIATISVGEGSRSIEFDSVNNRMYVTNWDDDTVSVINTATNGVIETISVGDAPHGMAFDSANNRMYVVNAYDNTISVINTATNAVDATIAAGTNPVDVALDSANDRLYVTNYNQGIITVIDTDDNTIITTISVGGPGNFPLHIAFDSTNDRMYVTEWKGHEVSVINTATNAVDATIAAGNFPTGIAFDSTNNRMYVSITSDDAVKVINTATNAVDATISVGNSPRDMAFDSTNNRMYVTDLADDTVSVIDIAPVAEEIKKSSSDCYDCEPPKLQSTQIQISSNISIIISDDESTNITANVGDEIEITLEITDDKSVHLLPTSGIYTNFMEIPNDMNLFFVNNFDDWNNTSTSFYEWNRNHDDVSYDYADTVMWSSPEISYVEFPVTDETSFEIINDDYIVEHFIISFKMKFTDSMESSQVWVSAADYYGQSFKVPLPLTLEILGDEPLDFTSTLNQKVLGYFNDPVLLSVLSQWSESSNEMSELSSILGVNGELPSWTANLATWTVEEKITPAEMIIAIEYVINHSA
jgi:YVTN family beta-propeller protein